MFHKTLFLTSSINDYRIHNHDLDLKFQNSLFNANIAWSKKISSTHYLQIINSTTNDIKIHQTILASETKIGITKEIDMAASVKCKNVSLANSDLGYGLSFLVKKLFLKNMFFNLKFEKIISTDYYTVFNNGELNTLPYACEGKLTYKFD